jgi:hypothetical protein
VFYFIFYCRETCFFGQVIYRVFLTNDQWIGVHNFMLHASYTCFHGNHMGISLCLGQFDEYMYMFIIKITRGKACVVISFVLFTKAM